MRPAALNLVEVATGEVLDTVLLVGTELLFELGAARDVFTNRRQRFGWTAAEAFDQFTGWSNGYVTFRPR